jgi:hypothetical protein
VLAILGITVILATVAGAVFVAPLPITVPQGDQVVSGGTAFNPGGRQGATSPCPDRFGSRS